MTTKRKSGPDFIAILIAVLVVVLAGVAIYSAVTIMNEEKAPPPTIEFGGQQIEVNENVQKSELDPDRFYTRDGKVYYNAENIKYGIDVSAHQGDIDWAKVKESGVDFAIIRAGYRGYGQAGTVNADDYFHQNMKGALENGIEVGVYFFSQAITTEEAEEEARFVLDLIEGYDVTYPVIFDWEYIVNVETARTHNYEQFDVSSFANAFSRIVADAGYDSNVYFNPTHGYLIYDIEEISEHTFWLAEYNEKPNFYYGFIIWQYTNKGSVPGISGPVDLNISFIDYYENLA